MPENEESRLLPGPLPSIAPRIIADRGDGGLLAVLQDARARVGRLLEAVWDHERDLVVFLAEDLEDDLSRAVERGRS